MINFKCFHTTVYGYLIAFNDAAKIGDICIIESAGNDPREGVEGITIYECTAVRIVVDDADKPFTKENSKELKEWTPIFTDIHFRYLDKLEPYADEELSAYKERIEKLINEKPYKGE